MLKPTSKLARARARLSVPEDSINSIGLVVSLIGLCVLFALWSPYFLQTANGLNIGRASAYTGIVAAVTTLVLISGAFDLSIGAVIALAGVVAARLLDAGMPLPLVLAACIGIGIACGLVNGTLVALVGINALIVTIGTQFIFRGFAFASGGDQGGELFISDEAFLYIGQGDLAGIPFPIFLLAAALVTVQWVLVKTRFGRHCYAAGGNAAAARLAGVAVTRNRMQVYVISGVGSALGGVVLAAYSGAGVAFSAMGAELQIIAAVILGGTSLMGGRGSVVGTLLGIAILGVLANGIVLVGLRNEWQLVVTGGVLLTAVVIDELRAKRRAR